MMLDEQERLTNKQQRNDLLLPTINEYRNANKRKKVDFQDNSPTQIYLMMLFEHPLVEQLHRADRLIHKPEHN